MPVPADLEFDADVRRRIYEYVERHGCVPPGEVREAVRAPEAPSDSKPARSGATPDTPLSPGEFAEHLEALLGAGHLIESDGRLRVAVEASPESVELDDGTPTIVRLAREEDSEGVADAIREVAGERTHIVAESVAEALDDEPVVRHTRRRSRVIFVARPLADPDDAEGESADEGFDPTAEDATESATAAEGPVMGWVHVDAPRLEKLRHTAELTVGVREQFRGRGVGSRLLVRGLAWADERGYRKVHQSVPATNDAAVDFLEAHDWSVEAVREDHYLVDGELVDEVMLAAWLDE